MPFRVFANQEWSHRLRQGCEERIGISIGLTLLKLSRCEMKFKAGLGILTTLVIVAASMANGQTPVTTITLGPNQIGLVKTTQGITTRIAFPDPVKEIICGDLYDAT